MLHDCVENALRNNVTWLILNDVDEMVYVVDPVHETLSSLLAPYTSDENVALISMQNLFYGVKDEHTADSFNQTKPMLAMRDFVYHSEVTSQRDHRSKTIVKPGQVEYPDVHSVADTTAGDTLYMDPWTQLRHNHYKGLGGCIRTVEDTTFRDEYVDRLEIRLSDVYGPVVEPIETYPNRTFPCLGESLKGGKKNRKKNEKKLDEKH